MGGCYIWYSEEGNGRDRNPPRPLLAVPNVTSHPSTASVQITGLLYCSAVLMCPLTSNMVNTIFVTGQGDGYNEDNAGED